MAALSVSSSSEASFLEYVKLHVMILTSLTHSLIVYSAFLQGHGAPGAYLSQET